MQGKRIDDAGKVHGCGIQGKERVLMVSSFDGTKWER